MLVVVAALELLDMGASGVGWLNAAWGVGGLLGGAVALGVLRRGRIARGLAGGCVLAGVALGLIASWPRPGVALALLVVLGVGYAWVEVAGLTLMQRLVSDEVLARVFGVVESTYVASTGLGSVLAPVAVALFGIEGALVAVAACLPLLAAVSWTRLARFEATTPIPERQFALLRSCSLFAPLPLATVENLAARLVPVAVTEGQEVIRQGDIGDRFYVIAQGHVAVECDGEPRRTEGPGEFFGEIALLRDTPRTATVHATEPGLLYALEREHFVCGVTGNPRSVLAADGVIETRLAAVGLRGRGRAGRSGRLTRARDLSTSRAMSRPDHYGNPAGRTQDIASCAPSTPPSTRATSRRCSRTSPRTASSTSEARRP